MVSIMGNNKIPHPALDAGRICYLPLGHPWGTLATVRGLWVSSPSQKSRYFTASETRRLCGS